MELYPITTHPFGDEKIVYESLMAEEQLDLLRYCDCYLHVLSKGVWTTQIIVVDKKDLLLFQLHMQFNINSPDVLSHARIEYHNTELLYKVNNGFTYRLHKMGEERD